MDNKKILVICGILTFILILLLTKAFFIKQEKFKESPNQEDVLCKNLEYNGQNKIDLVFFGKEETVKSYADFLFSFSPFNKNKKNFNVFYIENYKPDCKIYKSIATLCDTVQTRKKASTCPNDYVVVVDSSKSNEIRSSTLGNIVSLNDKHPATVLLHEAGHAIGFLGEEYEGEGIKLSSKAKNCVAEGKEFLDLDSKVRETDGRFLGCSRRDYYRSVKDGIMRSLNPETYGYGTFDEILMQQRIEEEAKKQSGITSGAIQEFEECEKSQYYLFEGTYNNQEKKVEKVGGSINRGCLSGNGYGDFDFRLKSEDGLITEGSFNPALLFTISPSSGEVFEYNNFVLSLPFVNKETILEIIDSEGNSNEIRLNMGAIACLQ